MNFNQELYESKIDGIMMLYSIVTFLHISHIPSISSLH